MSSASMDQEEGGNAMSGKPKRVRTSGASLWLTGGGEMGKLIREMNWSKTPLGPIESWPQSLKTSILLTLNSRYPMFVWWGQELINLYNDAYIPILGARHPGALGEIGRASCRERV